MTVGEDALSQADRLERLLRRALDPEIRARLVAEMVSHYGGSPSPTRSDVQGESLLAFADWFRNTYMTWLPNVPICTTCGIVMTESVHLLKYEVAFEPDASSWMKYKIIDGPDTLCQKVERYVCPKCHEVRFAGRENDVLILIRTRTGRCGEIAILFASVLLALGVRARLMFTQGDDHLWVEAQDGDEWLSIDVAAPDVRRLIKERFLFEKWGWKLTDLYAIEPGRPPQLVTNYRSTQ